MDWAEMLERMYSRWAADQGFACSVSERSVGEEAGIKSVELAVRGKWAYGYLKGASMMTTTHCAGDTRVVVCVHVCMHVVHVCAVRSPELLLGTHSLCPCKTCMVYPDRC